MGIRDDRKGRYSGLHTASLAEGLARGRAHHGLTECRALVAWLTATFESAWGGPQSTRSATRHRCGESHIPRVDGTERKNASA